MHGIPYHKYSRQERCAAVLHVHSVFYTAQQNIEDAFVKRLINSCIFRSGRSAILYSIQGNKEMRNLNKVISTQASRDA